MSDYQKHTWVANEVIRAKNLNHLEDGIYNEEQRARLAEEALSGRVTQDTQAITTLNGNASVVGSVDYKIAQATSDMGGYKVVADHTQVSNPSDKYIYLEPDNTVTGDDKFREWIYVDNTWKMIGDVSLDLSDYVQKTDYASDSAFGVAKVDGITIVSNNGILSSNVQGGVTSFNGRTGAVSPQSGDYSASDVGLGNVGNFKAVSTEASQGLTSTEQSNARANIGAGTSNFDGAYSSLTGAPTLGSAASLDVASSGDASTSEVVKGDDSRLTDARTPTSHTHTTSDISDFPSLANVATSGSYNDLSNKPTIPTATSDLTNDSGFITSSAVPTKTSDLTNDSGFIDYKAVSTVAGQGLSDTEKANARANIGAGSSTFSGDYNDLTNKPTLGTASALDVATSGDASTSQVVKGDDTRLTDSRTPTSHTHTTSDISNFPTLGTAAAKDVPTSGNASTTQVVMGNDSRLTDSRTPTSHTHTKSQITDFPTIPGGVKIGTSRSGATDTTLYFIRS